MRAVPHHLFFLLGALALAESGCASYVSDYVPPDDGRARVLFRDTRAIASLPATDGACLREIEGNPDGPPFRVRRGGGGVAIVYWVPLRPLPPPLLLPGGGGSGARELATGPRHLASPTLHGPGGGGGHASGGHASGGHASGGGHSSGGSSSNSGGGDLGKAAVAAAVLAIVVLPVITLALVFSTPESEPNMATSIDRVNLYNDLARSPGSPCAEPPAPEPPPPGEPAPEEP